MELMILITILSCPFEICTTSKSVVATFGSGAHFYVIGPMRIHPCNRLRAVNWMIIISINVHEMKMELQKNECDLQIYPYTTVIHQHVLHFEICLF